MVSNDTVMAGEQRAPSHLVGVDRALPSACDMAEAAGGGVGGGAGAILQPGEDRRPSPPVLAWVCMKP